MSETNERWIEIDTRGAALAGKQGALDVEIGEWLLAARDADVHRHLGYGSLAEYVERRLGLAPHATAERIRVAEALAALGETREALRGGALSFSTARELTRVAVPETEREWLEAASRRRAHAGPGDEGRSPYQVAIARCDDCGRAFQDARGESVEVTPELLERVDCDSQLVGCVDDASHVGRSAPRATQTIPPACSMSLARLSASRRAAAGATDSSARLETFSA